MIIILKLLLAHILGDFILQPGSWVEKKKQKKIAAPQLYIHVLVHAALMMGLLWDYRLWLPVAIITTAHFVIDLIKIYLQKPHNMRTWFFADQVMHIVSIVLAIFLFIPGFAIPDIQLTEKELIMATAIIFLTTPTSVIIKVIISKWSPFTVQAESESLESAGKYIGILERLFVLIFILSHHWEAIGFLIAAKSVFRFGDIKDAQNRKLTEYILIGTLLSFGIAVITAILTQKLL